MGQTKEIAFPAPFALFAVDPDALLDRLIERMKREGLVIKTDPDKWLTIAQVAAALGWNLTGTKKCGLK